MSTLEGAQPGQGGFETPLWPRPRSWKDTGFDRSFTTPVFRYPTPRGRRPPPRPGALASRIFVPRFFRRFLSVTGEPRRNLCHLSARPRKPRPTTPRVFKNPHTIAQFQTANPPLAAPPPRPKFEQCRSARDPKAAQREVPRFSSKEKRKQLSCQRKPGFFFPPGPAPTNKGPENFHRWFQRNCGQPLRLDTRQKCRFGPTLGPEIGPNFGHPFPKKGQTPTVHPPNEMIRTARKAG